jgi:hypothetical protein
MVPVPMSHGQRWCDDWLTVMLQVVKEVVTQLPAMLAKNVESAIAQVQVFCSTRLALLYCSLAPVAGPVNLEVRPTVDRSKFNFRMPWNFCCGLHPS